MSQGKTKEELIANIREAIDGWIETATAHGQNVPEDTFERSGDRCTEAGLEPNRSLPFPDCGELWAKRSRRRWPCAMRRPLPPIAPPGDILVGRDSRPSGRMLSLAIHAALQAVGRNTIDAGIVATPTAGVLLRHFKAAGAIQITASHNPPPYNGLKLFSADGRVIPAGPGREVLERYRTGTPDWLPHDRAGRRPALRRHGDGPSAGRAGHGRRRADPQMPVPRGLGQQPRRRQHFGPAAAARTWPAA